MTTQSAFLMATGIGETIGGALALANGGMRREAGTMILGMTMTNVGGRLQGLDSASHSELMQGALVLGTGAVGVQGSVRLARGVKQKNAQEIFKGSLQAAAGIVGSAFVYSLDSRIIVVAHQASLLALSSAFVAKFGAQELLKGRVRPGLCKVICGLGGIALSGYYAYISCAHKETLSPLPEDQIAFLKEHRGEIDEIYTGKNLSGNWKELGRGTSKTAFVHPDFPGWLIKVPNRKWGYRGATGEDDMRINYENFSQVQCLSTSYDQIILPKSHLYQTGNGIMIVEQRLDLVPGNRIADSPAKAAALAQFDAFKKAADLCDVSPEWGENSGFVRDSAPPRIGVIDFDCKSSQLNEILNRDFRNPRPQFFVPDNRNQITALMLATGIAITKAAAWAAKKIKTIEPDTILKLAVASGAAGALYAANLDGVHQPAAEMGISGIAMGVTAVLALAISKVAEKAVSLLSRWVLPLVPV
jgi:hypothetical protein